MHDLFSNLRLVLPSVHPWPDLDLRLHLLRLGRRVAERGVRPPQQPPGRLHPRLPRRHEREGEEGGLQDGQEVIPKGKGKKSFT